MADEVVETKSTKFVKAAEAIIEDIVYVPLHKFADDHALKYGIELMAGFFHVQEIAKKFADTEANWHAAIEAFAKEEVK